MRIAVCDNSAAAADQMCGMIQQYCNLYELTLHQITSYTDPDAFRHSQERYDVAFVGFGSSQGFLAAQQLRGKDRYCKIILIDDTDEYAIRGVRIHCTNFLLRPVEFRHIVQSMHLVTRRSLS